MSVNDEIIIIEWNSPVNTFSALIIIPRCIITTVDPETGVKDKDEQPLKELKRYTRLWF